jgi:hypothetical protein
VSTNATTIVTAQAITATDTRVWANCPTGDVALGGGVQSTLGSATAPHLMVSAPTAGAATSNGASTIIGNAAVAKGWVGEFFEGSGTTTTYVICSK